MATVALLGKSFNTTTGTHTTTKIPAVGDLLVIVSTYSAAGSPALPEPTDDNADGLGTYALAVSASQGFGGGKVYVWVREALVGSGTSTTFTQTTDGHDTGGGLAVLQVVGMANAGAAAIVKTGSQGPVASSAPSVSWTGGGSAAGTNPLIGVVRNATNPATMTKPTLFDTELVDDGYNGPTTGIEIVSDNTGNSSSVVSWGSSSASTFCAVIVEFNASVGGSITVTAASATAAAAAGIPTPKEVVLSTSATALAAAGVPAIAGPSNLTIVATSATASADAGVPTPAEVVLSTSARATAAAGVVGISTPANVLVIAPVSEATADAGIPTLVTVTDPNITITATVAVAHAIAPIPGVGRFVLNPEPDAATSFLTPRLDAGLPAIFLEVDPEPAGYGGAYPSLVTYPGSALFPGINIFGLDLIDQDFGVLLLTPAVDR